MYDPYESRKEAVLNSTIQLACSDVYHRRLVSCHRGFPVLWRPRARQDEHRADEDTDIDTLCW